MGRDLLVAIINYQHEEAKLLLHDITRANGKHRLAHTLKIACVAQELGIAQFLFDHCTPDVIFQALSMKLRPKLRSHKRCHWQHMVTSCTLFRFIHESPGHFQDDEERCRLAKTISTRLAGRRLKRLQAYEKYCRSFQEADPLEILESRPEYYHKDQRAASLIEDILDDVTIVRAGSNTSKKPKGQRCSQSVAAPKDFPELRPPNSFSCRKQKSRTLDNRCSRDQVSSAWWWYI